MIHSMQKNHLHSNGAPRQAAIAILGKPFLAIDKFEMKSSKQLPQARIVIPIEISDRLNATPIDWMVCVRETELDYLFEERINYLI